MFKFQLGENNNRIFRRGKGGIVLKYSPGDVTTFPDWNNLIILYSHNTILIIIFSYLI